MDNLNGEESKKKEDEGENKKRDGCGKGEKWDRKEKDQCEEEVNHEKGDNVHDELEEGGGKEENGGKEGGWWERSS